MEIKRIEQDFTVCQVKDYSLVNLDSEYSFIEKTDEEKSLVCITSEVPKNTIQRDDGWKAFRIQGVLDFSLIGILAKIATILADNGISIFAVSTYNTEYDSEYLNAKWTYNGEMACIIHRLCVSPEVQNRGIGKIVLNHIENQLQNIGVESVRLDVFSENPHAIRLYEKVAM